MLLFLLSLRPPPRPLCLSVRDCASSACKEEQAEHTQFTAESCVKPILTCVVDKDERQDGVLIHGGEAGNVITMIHSCMLPTYTICRMLYQSGQ